MTTNPPIPLEALEDVRFLARETLLEVAERSQSLAAGYDDPGVETQVLRAARVLVGACSGRAAALTPSDRALLAEQAPARIALHEARLDPSWGATWRERRTARRAARRLRRGAAALGAGA